MTIRQHLRNLQFLTAAMTLLSCGVASPPLETQQRAVPTPIDGQVTVVNEAEKPVGGLIPVYVAVQWH